MSSKVGRRLGNRKTTTGCTTCKIRRVKCDEGRPNCRRCASTGRRCDGYRDLDEIPKRRARHDHCTLENPTCCLSGPGLCDNEFYVLKFFVDQAAVQIAGWRGTDFWCSLVPQLSQNYRAIQHATITLGSLLLRLRTRATVLSPVAPDMTPSMATEAFALQHYGKAIEATISMIKGDNIDPMLASVTCILFVCIEALQGHEEQAISFFRQGRISVLRSKGGNEMTSYQLYKSPPSQKAEINSMFSRLALQFMMFGPGNEQLTAAHQAAYRDPIPIQSLSLQSLADAEDELLNMLSIVQGIALVGNIPKWRQKMDSDEVILSALRQRQQLAQFALGRWYVRFQEFMNREASGPAAETMRSNIGASMVLQQYHIMHIWLAGSLETNECFYDQFMQRFEIIVTEATLCSEFLTKRDNEMMFRLDMGWIPPLYWTALKCRHPDLRRRAVSLLDAGPKQEGLWDTRMVTRVALRAIELEEAGIRSSSESENDVEGIIVMPPEEDRIKAVIVNLRTTDQGQEGDFTDFLSMPNGHTSAWRVRREFFAL